MTAPSSIRTRNPKLLVAHMEMGRVIIEEHPHCNSKEISNSRHDTNPRATHKAWTISKAIICLLTGTENVIN
jgi:hypothetical protein